MRFSCFAQKSSEGPEEGVEHLLWNGQSIAFTIRRGSPRRKRTLIRVTRAGKVEVILPASKRGFRRHSVARGVDFRSFT